MNHPSLEIAQEEAFRRRNRITDDEDYEIIDCNDLWFSHDSCCLVTGDAPNPGLAVMCPHCGVQFTADHFSGTPLRVINPVEIPGGED